MRRMRRRESLFAETVGSAFLDFSRTGERARFNRRILISRNNYNEPRFRKVLRGIRKNF